MRNGTTISMANSLKSERGMSMKKVNIITANKIKNARESLSKILCELLDVQSSIGDKVNEIDEMIVELEDKYDDLYDKQYEDERDALEQKRFDWGYIYDDFDEITDYLSNADSMLGEYSDGIMWEGE